MVYGRLGLYQTQTPRVSSWRGATGVGAVLTLLGTTAALTGAFSKQQLPETNAGNFIGNNVMLEDVQYTEVPGCTPVELTVDPTEHYTIDKQAGTVAGQLEYLCELTVADKQNQILAALTNAEQTCNGVSCEGTTYATLKFRSR